jgi:hypothetical protein
MVCTSTSVHVSGGKMLDGSGAVPASLEGDFGGDLGDDALGDDLGDDLGDNFGGERGDSDRSSRSGDFGDSAWVDGAVGGSVVLPAILVMRNVRTPPLGANYCLMLKQVCLRSNAV